MSDSVHFTLPRVLRDSPAVRIRLLLCLFPMIGFAWMVRVPAVMAQQNTSSQGPETKPESKDVLKLVDEIDDIDRLRSLNPIKLTAEQLDRAIALITSAQATYQKKLLALAEDRVVKMSVEIRDVKQKMLAGGELPQDFDKRLQQASSDFIAKRDQLDLENIGAIATSLKEILSPEQVKAAVTLSRESPQHANKSAKATDDQWFNLYVAEVVLSYPRILPLLKEMRSQRTGAAAPASGGDSGGHR